MRICFVLSSFHPIWGGAENQTKLQAAELVRRGHQVSVITWRRDPAWPATEVVDGIEIHRVRLSRSTRWGLALSTVRLALRMLVSIRDCDVVVARNVNAPAHLAALCAWALRKPMVAVISTAPQMPGTELNQSNSEGVGGALRRAAIRFLAGHSVAVATTGSIEEGLLGRGFAHIARIPNAVTDPGGIDREAARIELREAARVPETGKLVVASGRFNWVKGFERLIRAWALTQAREVATLLLLGDGPEGVRLGSFAAELGVGDSVRFLSANPVEARGYLSVADLVVISSLYEGMSNVLLEAMLASVPVVSTPVSGSVDLIEDGVSGRLVSGDESAAMAAAIDATLTDPGSIGARGRQAVLDVCRLELVVDQMERVLANASSLPGGVLRRQAIMALPYPVTGEASPCVESAV